MLLRARAPPPPGNSNTPLLKRGTIAALVLSSLAAFFVIVAAFFYICKRNRKRRRARCQNGRGGHVSLNRLFPRKYGFRAHGDTVDGQDKEQVDSAKEQPFTGVILDIGHDSSQPIEIDDMSPDGVSNTGVCGGRRDSSKSSNSGFARWKKGLSTLSGLTALGLNFGHSDEKSPVSDDVDEREDCSSGLGVRVSHSLGRIGSNKSTGNGKGKGQLRGSSGSHDQSHDAESLSGLTSLSYVSNTAVYGHPPSYAASVSHNSHHSGSGSNASLQLQSTPRAVTRLPLNPDSPPVFLSDQSILLDRARISGIHILGIGGALSSIGAPISAHVALRGLSPRISRSKISDKGSRRQKDTAPEKKKKERGEEIKKRELPQLPAEQEASSSAAQLFPSPVPIAATGSPIRALPPIPTSQPILAASQSQFSPLRLTESPLSYLSAPESLPFKPSSNQDHDTITSPSSNNNTERRFKPRSPSSNVPGLGFPRGVQSFAEAAALAANLTTRGILVEGRGPGLTGIGSDGEPDQGTPKRLSTASRVRFEDDPIDLNPSSGEARFTLSLPSGRSLSPDAVSPVQGSSQSSDHAATASFLDLSSQSSSPPSQQQQSTKMELSTDIELESDRIWSMHLPGRRGAPKSEWNDTISPTSHIRSESSSSHSGYGNLQAQFSPVVPAPDAGTSDHHIFPFPLAIPPSQYMREGFTGVEPSPSLMSATTSIPVFIPPTSRRGNHDQRFHEPTTRTSETTHDQRILNDNNDSQDPHEISPQRSNTHEGMVFSSPTDSFPQSISEVHFRTSVGVDSDVDLEPGRVQYARHYSVRSRHRHRHQHSHPPLPSMPLTPQRFHPQQEQTQSPSQQGGSSIVQKIFGGGGGSGGK